MNFHKFCQFSHVSFFLVQDPTFYLDTVSPQSFFLFSFKALVSYFVECRSLRVYLMFSQDHIIHFWQEDHRSDVP